MSIPEEIQTKIGKNISEIVSYMLRECSICGKKMTSGRVIYNFKKPEGDKKIYIRGSVVCPECNERCSKQVDELKKGENFNLGIFDI